MIHAYNKIYLNSVIHNVAAVFDLANNAEKYTADNFAHEFSSSIVANGIESGAPDMLSGKSAAELLTIILGKDIVYFSVAMNRTPEYWGGWILAYAQWYLNKRFSDILSVISFSQIVALYHPYHEYDEMKMVEYIKDLFPKVPVLKRIRQLRKLTQKQLSVLSGVKLRSIQAYEQGDNYTKSASRNGLFACKNIRLYNRRATCLTGKLVRYRLMSLSLKGFVENVLKGLSKDFTFL